MTYSLKLDLTTVMHSGLNVWQSNAVPRDASLLITLGTIRGVAMHPLSVNAIKHQRDPHAELDALLTWLDEWIEGR